MPLKPKPLKQPPALMRVTWDAELHARLLARAQASKIPMGHIVEQALRGFLDGTGDRPALTVEKLPPTLSKLKPNATQAKLAANLAKAKAEPERDPPCPRCSHPARCHREKKGTKNLRCEFGDCMCGITREALGI